MSGLEVVGVVLGAIPIIVSALDEYKTAKRFFIVFRTIEAELEQLRIELVEEEFLIKHYFKHLLRTAGVHQDLSSPRDTQELLVQDHIIEALKEHLGELFGPYKTALHRCEHIIWDITKNIKGLMPGKRQLPENLNEIVETLTPTASGRYAFAAKIKFGLKYDELRQRIDELAKARAKLDAIIKAASQKNEADSSATPVRSSSKDAAKLATFLDKVHGQVNALYWTIAEAWSQCCHPQHRARLFLENQHELLVPNKRTRKKPITFRIVFESSSSGMSQDDSLRRGMDVELLNEKEASNSDARSSATVVRFATPPESQSQSMPQREQVRAICDLLQQAEQRPDQILKVFLSQRRLSKSFHNCSDSTIIDQALAIEQTDQIVKLADLYISSTVMWTLKQRMALAFNLSSSLLQLNSTPWLPDYWTRDRVCFLKSADNEVMLNRPFILGHFDDKALPTRYEPIYPSYRLSARRPLLELGITLMEIYHRETVDAYSNRQGNAPQTSHSSRYQIARVWLLEMQDNMASLYIDAVKNCIECCLPTDSGSPDWSDKTFQVSICNSIITPLWENCKNFG